MTSLYVTASRPAKTAAARLLFRRTDFAFVSDEQQIKV